MLFWGGTWFFFAHNFHSSPIVIIVGVGIMFIEIQTILLMRNQARRNKKAHESHYRKTVLYRPARRGLQPHLVRDANWACRVSQEASWRRARLTSSVNTPRAAVLACGKRAKSMSPQSALSIGSPRELRVGAHNLTRWLDAHSSAQSTDHYRCDDSSRRKVAVFNPSRSFDVCKSVAHCFPDPVRGTNWNQKRFHHGCAVRKNHATERSYGHPRF